MRAAAALAALLLAPPAGAQAGPWSLSGSNHARVEHYEASGDLGASPFPHLGTFSFDEIAVQALAKPTAYSQYRFNLAGVANDSDYRSSHRGFATEQLSVFAESGDGALPWRAQAGDFFAFTTLRTLQRPLKGAMVEVQPVAGEWRHSGVAFAGAAQHDWQRLQWSDENVYGASWLAGHERFGNWNATVLRHRRGPGEFGPARERRQTVASLAADHVFALTGAWKLRAEGEIAAFDGDHDDGEDAIDRRDNGYFAQATLFDGRFTGRVRAERYGADYRPFGAVTSPDRRSVEAHAGWITAQGINLGARVQRFRDLAESGNPLETRVAGVNAAGFYSPWKLSGSLDAFVQDVDRDDGSVDSRSTNVFATLSWPLTARVAADLSASRSEQRDFLQESQASRSSQLQAGLRFDVANLGFKGSIRPALGYLDVKGPGARREWQPSLTLGLERGRHSVSATLGRVMQDPRVVDSPEVATLNASIDYRYKWGRHEVGLDLIAFDRRPEPGEKTQAWRVGVSWRYSFGRDPAMLARAAFVRAHSPLPLAARLPRSVRLLAAVAPGHEAAAVEAALGESGFGQPQREAGALVYEARLLPEIEQRQRLVVVHDAGLVDHIALTISLQGASDPARLYERVRRSLFDAFGAPAVTFEEGAWSPAFANDLLTGRFVRVSEWATPTGVLRLGIPRRLDGPPRIEIHHRATSLSPRDPAWGVRVP